MKFLAAVLLQSVFFVSTAQHVAPHITQHTSHVNAHPVISNETISGMEKGCKHQTQYFTNPNVKVPMCTGQTDQDQKNGMSIINLIHSRGYLPTCRVMQLMLWMAAVVSDKGALQKDHFVDIGANIGSCSVHMASLGFPVILAEPVQQHVDTIRGTKDINPSFHIDLQHIGISSTDRSIKANFGHGARNWGASEFHEVGKNETFETELVLKTLDQVIGSRRVALMKVDCEGCEWEALKGGKRSLRRIPMIKMELVQKDYAAGNETMTPKEIMQFLNRTGYETFADHWNEQDLYFGKHNKDVKPIDELFGSDKFKLPASEVALNAAAGLILRNPLEADTFNHGKFLKAYTDVIAIEKGLAEKMKKRFLYGPLAATNIPVV